MLKHTPVTDQSETPYLSTARKASASATPTNGSSLTLRMSYPDPRMAVLSAVGDLDSATTPRLSELLWPRMHTKLSAIVIDLGEVTFLGVDAMELLSSAHAHADQKGIALSVVNNSHCVDRALTAGGLDVLLPCFDSVLVARQSALRTVRDATERTQCLAPTA